MRRRPVAASLAAQAFALRACYPGGALRLSVGKLQWTGALTPTTLSATYTVRIDYRLSGHPHVRVEHPHLDGRPGEALPHTYRTGTLCLYCDGEWSSRTLIAHTIVPWTSEWLYYYELWLPGGDWYGGGEWPPVRTSDSKHGPSLPRQATG